MEVRGWKRDCNYLISALSLRSGLRLIAMTIIPIAMSLYPLSVESQPRGGGSAGAFLRLGAEAGAVGLGNAFISITDAAYAVHWNPAGLVNLTDRELALSFRRLSLERTLSSIAYAQPVRPSGEFGVSWINANAGSIEARDADGRKAGSVENSENAFCFSFARSFGSKIAAGICAKYLYQILAEQKARGTTFDMGALFKPVPQLSIALVIRNLGGRQSWQNNFWKEETDKGTLAEFKLPLIVSTGLSYQTTSKRWLVSVQADNQQYEGTSLNVGGELRIVEKLSFRMGSEGILGYADRPRTPVAVAAIFRISKYIGIEYAYTADGDLDAGSSHLLSSRIIF